MQLLEVVALEANSCFGRRHLERAGQRQMKAAEPAVEKCQLVW